MARLSVLFIALSLSLFSYATTLPSSPGQQPSIWDDGVIFSGVKRDELFTIVSFNGHLVPVQLDLEGSDVYVTGPLPPNTYTASDKPSKYGKLVSSTIDFDGKTAAQYFYTLDQAPEGWPQPPLNGSAYGRLGLGPTSCSHVWADGQYHSLMDQVLSKQDKKYITILAVPYEKELGPFNLEGHISVGETIDLPKRLGISSADATSAGIPDLSAIKDRAKIPLGERNIFPLGGIQVNGKVLEVSSSVSGNPYGGKLVAKASTTTPYIVAPKAVVDAVYASVPGASYSAEERLYHLPCDVEIDADVLIGDDKYPLHPLHLVVRQYDSDQCRGAFQVAAEIKEVDITLGVLFLKNVYTMYGYDEYDGKTMKKSYYKFLSLTDPSAGHDDFALFRSGGAVAGDVPTHTVFTTVTHTPTSTVWIGSPSASATQDPTSQKLLGNLAAFSDDDDIDELRKKANIYFIVMLALAGVTGVTLFATILYCILSRRQNKGAAHSAYKALHVEQSERVNVPLYGAEEGGMRYSDPYRDDTK